MTETIFFPHSGDVTEAHSWLTIEGVRFCLGFLASCRFCSCDMNARPLKGDHDVG